MVRIGVPLLVALGAMRTTSAASPTHVIVVGVENLDAEDFLSHDYSSSKGGFGRMVNNGVVATGTNLHTWSSLFQPSSQEKSFFDYVNDRVVEMKQYHLVIADKFAQDFKSAAFHSWPRFNKIFEYDTTVTCPPYTSWTAPCHSVQDLQLVDSCVAYDTESFDITGDGECPTGSSAVSEDSNECTSCKEKADSSVIASIVSSLEASTTGNIVFGYLQAESLSTINKSLHTLFTAVDNAEDDAATWTDHAVIVTGGTHATDSSKSTIWLAYGAGLRNDEGGVEVHSDKISDDFTLATTLKLLGLDSTYSTPTTDVFYKAPDTDGSSSSSSSSSSGGASYATPQEKSCLQHSGYLGVCPSAFESWLYDEFPQHVALYSFVAGITLSLGLVVLVGVVYAVVCAAIVGSKKVLGYRSVAAGDDDGPADAGDLRQDVEGGKRYEDNSDSD